MRRRDVFTLPAVAAFPVVGTTTLAAPSGPEPIVTAPRERERTLYAVLPGARRLADCKMV